MTFDEWADGIDARVAAQVPGVTVKRKFDDMRRWIHGGKECQIHALSESTATFVLLGTHTAALYRPFACHIPIAYRSEEETAAKIIRWFLI